MNERDSILTRIAEALRVPSRGGDAARLPTPEEQRRVLPAAEGDTEALLNQFARNAAELRADFKLLPEPASLASEVRALRERHGWRHVAAHHGPLCDVAIQALELPALYTDEGFDKHALARCDVGVTECDALVAQTGTVVLSSRSAGGRALSVLPPHHLVLARREQLVADLPAAFALLRQKYHPDFPSMISLVTGPSRTGDIERILVLGAHGPRQLTILCI